MEQTHPLCVELGESASLQPCRAACALSGPGYTRNRALPLPLTRDVVLVGGGHTHALVLRRWGMRPVPGAQVTLINPGPTTPYSGMLPGHVAGHYDRDALDIDLVQLARFAGARLILGAATAVDPVAREVHVPGRPPVGFDLCAIDVGITSAMPDLPGFSDHGIPAKPLGLFAERWAAYLAGEDPASVAVLGAGVAGVELALAMAHALKAAKRPATVHLLDRSAALTAVDVRTAKRLRATMSDLGVDLRENVDVIRVAAETVALADGEEIPSTFTTGAAGACAEGWLADSGLAQENGFLTVNSNLQTSDPAIFATGDCAHLGFDPRPKAGVYAVRQAPILYNNLTAALTGGRMRAYKPQKDYLKLISLGGKSALAHRGGRFFSGALMWRWKDHIDQKFMNRFRDLPAMVDRVIPPVHAEGLQQALGDKPLCGGCGSKIGRTPLRAALVGMPATTRKDVRALPGDDAALLQMGDVRQVLSTDHLRAFVPDPVVMARIATVHALGDIWAMGAQPQAATISLILPPLAPELQARTLRDIMETAQDALAQAGAAVVGGHTTTGPELTIGLTLTGLCAGDPITLAGGQPGDVLILTKPIGSGVILAGEMAGHARGADVAAAYDLMQRGQGTAARILAPVAHAMTDVTGFGLAGHLHGLCEASGTGAALDLDAVPLMQGAAELAAQGVRSSIYADNRALALEITDAGKAALLFDPQTSGGLLAAVAPDAAEMALKDLREAGEPAAQIGVLTDSAPRLTLT